MKRFVMALACVGLLVLLAGCDDPAIAGRIAAENIRVRVEHVQKQLPKGCTYREVSKLTQNGMLSGYPLHVITCAAQSVTSMTTETGGKSSHGIPVFVIQ